MELKGNIEKIFETQVVGSNGFQKREFVVVTRDNYPQHIKFEMTQDRCKYLDNYKEGEPVVVSFDIKGREYNGKYFVNLQSWKVVKDGEMSGQSSAAVAEDSGAGVDLSTDEKDDLPF